MENVKITYAVLANPANNYSSRLTPKLVEAPVRLSQQKTDVEKQHNSKRVEK